MKPEDQERLERQWRDLSTGKRLSLWMKYGFRHKNPPQLDAVVNENRHRPMMYHVPSDQSPSCSPPSRQPTYFPPGQVGTADYLPNKPSRLFAPTTMLSRCKDRHTPLHHLKVRAPSTHLMWRAVHLLQASSFPLLLPNKLLRRNQHNSKRTVCRCNAKCRYLPIRQCLCRMSRSQRSSRMQVETTARQSLRWRQCSLCNQDKASQKIHDKNSC